MFIQLPLFFLNQYVLKQSYLHICIFINILFPYFHSKGLDSLSIFYRLQLFCSQHKAQENGVYIVYQLDTNKTIENTTFCRQIIHF